MEDILLIKGAFLAVCREAQARFHKEKDKIELTAAAAQIVTRLNEGTIDAHDVFAICTTLEKTRELLQKDLNLSRQAKELGRVKCSQLILKLEGDDTKKVILS